MTEIASARGAGRPEQLVLRVGSSSQDGRACCSAGVSYRDFRDIQHRGREYPRVRVNVDEERVAFYEKVLSIGW